MSRRNAHNYARGERAVRPSTQSPHGIFPDPGKDVESLLKRAEIAETLADRAISRANEAIGRADVLEARGNAIFRKLGFAAECPKGGTR